MKEGTEKSVMTIKGVGRIEYFEFENDIWIWRSDILHNKFVKDLKLGTENIYFTIEGPDVYIIANTSFMSPSFFKTVVDNPKVFKKIAKRIKKFAPIKHVKYGIEGHKGNKFTI